MKLKIRETRLHGISICSGIAIGKTLLLKSSETVTPEYSLNLPQLESEILRYRKAIEKGKEEISFLQRRMEQERIQDGAAILEAQIQMMSDPLLTTHVENEIQRTLKNAESVFLKVIEYYQQKFNSLTDPFFRERFKDIEDISKRIMNYLNGGETFTLGKSFPGSIVFARDLTPTDIAEAGSAFVHGFVCEKGSATSHAAIVAKAKGIPFVTNVNFESAKCLNGDVVIVDGRSGDIILNPSPETLRRYQDMQLQLQLHVKNLTKSKQLESETYDGYAIKLSANIEMVSELEMIHQYGGNGVGLFRSEYICLANNKFPSEDEQFEIYKNVVEKMLGLPIVIRTFDIGGDKLLGNSHFNKESHSFLGCRAIRFLLKEREIFKAQLKAIIRASVYGKVSILFPMISTLSELIEAKQVVKEVQVELEKKKIQYHPHIRIGCMIEVPSAAMITDLLAKECDFLSIGTNDLVQYSLAADRGNHAMSGFYTPTHPSVIRLIKLVVSEANINGIPVTICGEVAADPRFTSLLLGLGVHELSVASRYIPIIKNAIRNTSIVAATKLAEEALRLATANEIQELINQEYMKNVPDAFFYNF